MLQASAALALFTYCVWAFELPTSTGSVAAVDDRAFAACLSATPCSYERGDGEAPEDVLLNDRWLLAAGGAWLALFALGVHAAG